jgi:hypothetical protein
VSRFLSEALEEEKLENNSSFDHVHLMPYWTIRELHIVEAQMQAQAVYQLRPDYQLITLGFICPFEYRKTLPFGWLPEIPGGHNFRAPISLWNP